MASNVTYNGSIYSIPAEGDENWGSSLSSYFIALSTGSLTRSGGTFTLTADVDFGTSFGLKYLYYKSRATNPSSSGIVRLGNDESLSWRNAANSADLGLKVNTSNILEYNGNTVRTGLIVNSDVDAAAAIAYSKLNLSNSILNVDINASAAIAYSKLNLSNSIVNADINSSAAIVYSKLNIADGDLSIAKTSGLQAALDSKLNLSTVTTSGDMLYATGSSAITRLPIGQSGQVLKTVSGVPTWATFSGGINYMSSNPDSEGGTTGWATFADAAQSTPVDGTAGSANITWTSSSSSPLRGSNSFLLTKDAVNRQGQGVSFDFTIDSADRAKVLQGSFDYAISSGTYADDQMTIWIYDVTNAVLIQPAPYLIKNHSGSAEKFFFEFQTSSSSSSYRLILHISGTSASAYTLKFDNFNLGPQAKLYGSPVTDWVSYTPTWTNLTVGNATNSFEWRKIGDSIQLRGRLVWGSTSSGSGTFQFSLPSGLSVDNSKLQSLSNRRLGTATAYDTGGTVERETFSVYQSGSGNTFSILGRTDAGSSGSFATTYPFTWATGDELYIQELTVPISGWGSSQIMSHDASTRSVAFCAHRAASNQTGVNPNNSDVKVLFNSIALTSGVGLDTHGVFDTSNNRYTVSVPGNYVFSVNVDINSTNTLASLYRLKLYKNGSEICRGDSYSPNGAGEAFTLNLNSPPLSLSPTDYIEVYLFGAGNNSASTLTINGAVAQTKFGGYLIQGPSQILASDTVASAYNTSAAQSISDSSWTIINFGTKEHDYTNSVTTGASWKFTAPISGLYQVSAFVTLSGSGSWTSGEQASINVYKNGSAIKRVGDYQSDSTNSNYVSIETSSSCLRLIAGDYIDLRIFQNSGGSVPLSSSANENWVSIVKIGNY